MLQTVLTIKHVSMFFLLWANLLVKRQLFLSPNLHNNNLMTQVKVNPAAPADAEHQGRPSWPALPWAVFGWSHWRVCEECQQLPCPLQAWETTQKSPSTTGILVQRKEWVLKEGFWKDPRVFSNFLHPYLHPEWSVYCYYILSSPTK